uniref:Vacuolar protein sorting-associated protein 13 DH-like domain-containing protein n=1 Tax=Meloidogyne javanica TaxID=6303 RepID=A0A915M6F5_MELJA
MNFDLLKQVCLKFWFKQIFPDTLVILRLENLIINCTNDFYKLLYECINQNFGEQLILQPELIPNELLEFSEVDLDEPLEKYATFFKVLFNSFIDSHSEIDIICKSATLEDSTNSNNTAEPFKKLLKARHEKSYNKHVASTSSATKNIESKKLLCELHIQIARNECHIFSFILIKTRVFLLFEWIEKLKLFLLLVTNLTSNEDESKCDSFALITNCSGVILYNVYEDNELYDIQCEIQDFFIIKYIIDNALITWEKSQTQSFFWSDSNFVNNKYSHQIIPKKWRFNCNQLCIWILKETTATTTSNSSGSMAPFLRFNLFGLNAQWTSRHLETNFSVSIDNYRERPPLGWEPLLECWRIARLELEENAQQKWNLWLRPADDSLAELNITQTFVEDLIDFIEINNRLFLQTTTTNKTLNLIEQTRNQNYKTSKTTTKTSINYADKNNSFSESYKIQNQNSASGILKHQNNTYVFNCSLQSIQFDNQILGADRHNLFFCDPNALRDEPVVGPFPALNFEMSYTSTDILDAYESFRLKLFLTTDKNALPPCLRLLKERYAETLLLVNFENALVTLAPFWAHRCLTTLNNLFANIVDFYIGQLKKQKLNIFIAMDAIGNPSGFATEFKEGFEGLLFEGDVAGFTFGIGYGAANNQHEQFRRWMLRSKPENEANALGYLYGGLKGFGVGVYGGLTAIAKNTFVAARQEGGVIRGVTTGAVDTFTKPLQGTLDLVEGTASAIREVVGAPLVRRAHFPKKRLRSPRVCSSMNGLLPSYSNELAEAQQDLLRITGTYALNDDNRLLCIVPFYERFTPEGWIIRHRALIVPSQSYIYIFYNNSCTQQQQNSSFNYQINNKQQQQLPALTLLCTNLEYAQFLSKQMMKAKVLYERHLQLKRLNNIKNDGKKKIFPIFTI